MTSPKKKVKPVVKVQLIVYACPHCGNEIEEVKLCPMCSHPMRVVEVKEMYGDEAEKLLNEINENKEVSTLPTDEGMEVDSSSIESPDLYLDDIYADDEDDTVKPSSAPSLEDALSILDEEDDDLDIPDLPAL